MYIHGILFSHEKECEIMTFAGNWRPSYKMKDPRPRHILFAFSLHLNAHRHMYDVQDCPLNQTAIIIMSCAHLQKIVITGLIDC